MTTINVTVENSNQAKMLLRWLNEIKFVKKTSLKSDKIKKENSEEIQAILSTIKPNQIFSEINDPIEFQNQLRNEW